MKFAISLTALVLAATLWGVEADMDAYKASQDARSAERCGYTVEQWRDLTPMERLRAMQEARAARQGKTVEQMREDNDAKSAERCGYTVEEWKRMTPMERLRAMQEARAIKAGFTK